jgi:hypothetical protein
MSYQAIKLDGEEKQITARSCENDSTVINHGENERTPTPLDAL